MLVLLKWITGHCVPGPPYSLPAVVPGHLTLFRRGSSKERVTTLHTRLSWVKNGGFCGIWTCLHSFKAPSHAGVLWLLPGAHPEEHTAAGPTRLPAVSLVSGCVEKGLQEEEFKWLRASWLLGPQTGTGGEPKCIIFLQSLYCVRLNALLCFHLKMGKWTLNWKLRVLNSRRAKGSGGVHHGVYIWPSAPKLSPQFSMHSFKYFGKSIGFLSSLHALLLSNPQGHRLGWGSEVLASCAKFKGVPKTPPQLRSQDK